MSPKYRDIITELSILLLLPLIFLFLFSLAALISTGTTNIGWLSLSLTGIITISFILAIIHETGSEN